MAVSGNLREFGAASSPVECFHQHKVHMKRKLTKWRAQIWKLWIGAKGVSGRADLQTTESAAIPRKAVRCNLRKFGAASSPIQCLHQRKIHMKMKLNRLRAKIWKPWYGAKSVPTKTCLKTTASTAISRRAVSRNLGKIGATSSPVKCLHQCKVHMKRKRIESPNMKTPVRCKRRTGKGGYANN